MLISIDSLSLSEDRPWAPVTAMLSGIVGIVRRFVLASQGRKDATAFPIDFACW
jgi:hypothetical protein